MCLWTVQRQEIPGIKAAAIALDLTEAGRHGMAPRLGLRLVHNLRVEASKRNAGLRPSREGVEAVELPEELWGNGTVEDLEKWLVKAHGLSGSMQLGVDGFALLPGQLLAALLRENDEVMETSVQKAVDEVARQSGAVDVLVQAAGITGKTNLKTHEVDAMDFQRVFDVNVKAVFLCAKAVVPLMLKNGYGRIVNIASISGKDGRQMQWLMAGGNGKIGKLGSDITVNCIAPAVVQTAYAQLPATLLPDLSMRQGLDTLPTQKRQLASDMVAVVAGRSYGTFRSIQGVLLHDGLLPLGLVGWGWSG
eukprot:Skav200914  [mRNA]  locus=scaffold2433:71001:83667:+ [translate_table: standard]